MDKHYGLIKGVRYWASELRAWPLLMTPQATAGD